MAIFLEIVFRNSDLNFAGRDQIEDPLHDALEAAGVGEVTGGGSGPERCNVDVEVTDLSVGLAVIRKTLLAIGCPDSTEIHQDYTIHALHE